MPVLDTAFDILTTAGYLILVVLGFGLIILIHEAGHFFAAKWAGIRVLAFALGFGPALISYRKGLGFRRGSSEKELHELQKDAVGFAGERRENARATLSKVSPTEYRLNALPFGGYVKMLGQDDADPAARSDEPDSYQNCPPPKRMVVISAGVIANLVTAALMFIVVFRVGLVSEPATVGTVDPSGPAASAIASNAAPLGITEPGLKPGDKIVSIDGTPPAHFNEVQFRVVYAEPDTPLRFTVERPGVKGLLDFSIKPVKAPGVGMYAIGINPAESVTLIETVSRRSRAQFAEQARKNGFDGLKLGMTLVEVDGRPVKSLFDASDIITRADGRPVPAVFTSPSGERANITLKPEATLQSRLVTIGDQPRQLLHLLGLTPVLSAGPLADKVDNAREAGLKEGDVFTRVGAIEYPSMPQAIREIQAHAGKKVRVTIARKNDAGAWTDHDLGDIPVTADKTIGFNIGDAGANNAFLASWPSATGAGAAPSGATINAPAGSRIIAVDGVSVSSLSDVRDHLRARARELPAGGGATLDTKLTLELPYANIQDKPVETIAWTIPAREVSELRNLGWDSALSTLPFDRMKFIWKADSSGEAINMALHETQRNMAMTLLTIKRLFQRTVSPANLKGPVGIAHIGVSIADRGFIWLLFYMALISVNLAVINFLPIPITDGGHMLFLIFEQITGKQPPVVVQNVATIAGLLVIGSLFLYVTFNDISGVYRAITAFFS